MTNGIASRDRDSRSDGIIHRLLRDYSQEDIHLAQCACSFQLFKILSVKETEEWTYGPARCNHHGLSHGPNSAL